MRIRVGDVVKVITGNKDVKGKVGKVVSIDLKKERVVLENGPIHKKHLKPERSRKQPEGGVVERPASIHVSNVMLFSEANNRPVRIGFTLSNGEKSRVARGRGLTGQQI